MTPISTGSGGPGNYMLPIDENRYWMWMPAVNASGVGQWVIVTMMGGDK